MMGCTIRHSTGLSAQANLCGHGETSFFCARFSADEQTATTAGPARSIGGGIDYSKRLDADQSISFSLGVTHYSTPISVLVGPDVLKRDLLSCGGHLLASARDAPLRRRQPGCPETDPEWAGPEDGP